MFTPIIYVANHKNWDNKRLFPPRCLHVIKVQYISIPVVIAMRTNSSSSVKIIICLLLISGKNKLTSKDYSECNAFYSGDWQDIPIHDYINLYSGVLYPITFKKL